MGPILEANLIRLGFAETQVKTAEIARLVSEKGGRPMSRQRVAALLNSVNISDEVMEALARGLGVKVSELTRVPREKK